MIAFAVPGPAELIVIAGIVLVPLLIAAAVVVAVVLATRQNQR